MNPFFKFLIWILGGALALTFAFSWLGNHPGSISIEWLHTHIHLTMDQAFLWLLLMGFGTWVLHFLLGLIKTIPQAYQEFKKTRAQARDQKLFWKALQALPEGDGQQLIALGSKLKDSKMYGEFAAFFRLEGYLKNPPKEMGEAEALALGLLENPVTSSYAMGSLLRIALLMDDDSKAIRYSQKIKDLKEHLILEEQVLAAHLREGILNRERGILEESQRLLSHALEMCSRHPSFWSDVTLAYVDILKITDQKRRALKVIESTWSMVQNEELWQTYLHLNGTRTPEEEFKFTQRLASFAPDSIYSRYFVIKAAISAKLIGFAARELEILRGFSHVSKGEILQDTTLQALEKNLIESEKQLVLGQIDL